MLHPTTISEQQYIFVKTCVNCSVAILPNFVGLSPSIAMLNESCTINSKRIGTHSPIGTQSNRYPFNFFYRKNIGTQRKIGTHRLGTHSSKGTHSIGTHSAAQVLEAA